MTTEEYSNLANDWSDFIDWNKRRLGENGWLTKQLSKCKSVFDASVGEGCDSIYLIKQGFDVTSNDIDENFIKVAQINANRENVRLKLTKNNWLELKEKMPKESFDAVILLGNSITHLFKKEDRLKTLENFLYLLRKNGILIIDERNYSYILDNRENILNGNFRYSKKYVYCGEKMQGKPVEISNSQVVFRYIHERRIKGEIKLYPFKKDELQSEIKQSGFTKIKQFSDYKKGYNYDADFYQYVAIK